MITPMTMKEVLDYKISRWNKNNARNRNAEALYCDYLEDKFKDIFNGKYEIESIAREFMLPTGRLDFLFKLKNDRYVIVEVKHSNEKTNDSLAFSFAVGQLLTYGTILRALYEIPIEDIDLILITDTDELLPLNTVMQYKLPISIMIVGYEVVKYYGSE